MHIFSRILEALLTHIIGRILNRPKQANPPQNPDNVISLDPEGDGETYGFQATNQDRYPVVNKWLFRITTYALAPILTIFLIARLPKPIALIAIVAGIIALVRWKKSINASMKPE